MPLCSHLKRFGALNLTLQPARRPLGCSRLQRSPLQLYSTTESNRKDERPSIERSAAEYESYLDFALGASDHGAPKQKSEDVAPSQEGPTVSPANPARKKTRAPRPSKEKYYARMAELNKGKNVQWGGPAHRHVVRRTANDKGRETGIRITHLRTDTRPSAIFSSDWSTNFAKIARPYDPKLRDHEIEQSSLPTLHPLASEWTELFLDRTVNDDEKIHMDEIAFKYKKLRREVWSQVALWLLAYDKSRVADFLLATHTNPYAPINYVEDCLQHLAEYVDSQEGGTAKEYCTKIVDTFCILAARDNQERMELLPTFIRLLLPRCTSDQVSKIYKAVKVNGIRLSPHTLHHLSATFTESGHLEQGIDALLEAHAAGADTNSVSFRSNCSTLLRRTMNHPGGLRMTMRLIDNMVNLGVSMSNQLLNIVMLNAVDARDPKTAFLVYHSLREHGLKPDEYTYTILLMACEQDIDNAELLNEVIRDAIESGAIRGNTVVATEVLHCLAKHHVRRDKDNAWSIVINAYLELFDAVPLRELGLEIPQPLVHVGNEAIEHRVMPPSPHAICIVLATYLHYGPPKPDAAQIYAKWQELVKLGHQPHASLATEGYASLVFLIKFIQQKVTLLNATQVVKDMQAPLPASAGVEQCSPNVIIWSAFLHGFVKHRQMALAEQVLTYMRSKGVEPNDVTWNTLVLGYARVHDADGILDALRRLDASGEIFDRFTYGGIKKFGNRNRQLLAHKMKQVKLERNLDFTSDLKNGLERRLHSLETQHALGDEEQSSSGSDKNS